MTQITCFATFCKYNSSNKCIKESITILNGQYGSEWVHTECSNYIGRNNK